MVRQGGVAPLGVIAALSGTAGDPLSSGTAKQIAAGSSHTCAILSNDTVKCWGANDVWSDRAEWHLKIVIELLVALQETLSVVGQLNILQRSVNYTCAILSNDTVKCWGDNASGQTGGGSPLSQWGRPPRTLRQRG